MTHEDYIHRCFELAKAGSGYVAPNPLVGSVIVHDDQIIGEGYHEKYGGPHAEVNAIRSVQDCTLLKHSTLYVNLEPCAHFGKTPPCANLIIDCGIPHVVISHQDPFSAVAGKGIERMRAAGIEVTVGILEKEGRYLNRRFLTYHEKQRPYIVLKWAETKDGFIDRTRNSTTPTIHRISSDETNRLVHQWRVDESAILVGAQTVINDDPQLTARMVEGPQPLRVIIDPNGRLNKHYNAFNSNAPTLLFTSASADYPSNVEVVSMPCFMHPHEVLNFILSQLFKRSILSVLVEGGARTLHHFIEAQLWDEARQIIGNTSFHEGLAAPRLPVKAQRAEISGSDHIYFYYA